MAEKFKWIITPTNKLTEVAWSITRALNSFEDFDFNSAKLEPEQLETLKIIETVLQQLTEDALSEVTPDVYTSFDWSTDTPTTPLFDLREQLFKLFDVVKNIRICDNVYKLPIQVAEKIDLINQALDNYNKIIFASKLKYLAVKKKLTQQDLADRLQIRQQTISDWYRAKSLPSVSTMLDLAAILKTSTDFLLRPDTREVNLEDDLIYKGIGLTAENVAKLKGLKVRATEELSADHDDSFTFIIEDKLKAIEKAKEIAYTLNSLIQHYDCGVPDTDILKAINEYLRLDYRQPLFIITEDILNQIYSPLASCTDIEKAKAEIEIAIKQFAQNGCSGFNCNSAGAAYDVNTALLLQITNTLVRVKDEQNAKLYAPLKKDTTN